MKTGSLRKRIDLCSSRRKREIRAVSTFDVVRVCKAAHYHEALTNEKRARLPPNPIGMVELADTDRSQISGAFRSGYDGEEGGYDSENDGFGLGVITAAAGITDAITIAIAGGWRQ